MEQKPSPHKITSIGVERRAVSVPVSVFVAGPDHRGNRKFREFDSLAQDPPGQSKETVSPKQGRQLPQPRNGPGLGTSRV